MSDINEKRYCTIRELNIEYCKQLNEIRQGKLKYKTWKEFIEERKSEKMKKDYETMRKELEKAAMPLLEFLNKYYDPHTYAVANEGRVEIVCGDMSVPLPVRD